MNTNVQQKQHKQQLQLTLKFCDSSSTELSKKIIFRLKITFFFQPKQNPLKILHKKDIITNSNN